MKHRYVRAAFAATVAAAMSVPLAPARFIVRNDGRLMREMVIGTMIARITVE